MTPARHPPRKRFGQNFLVDRHYVDRIIAAVDPAPGDNVVEIGPGLGALTRPLLDRVERLAVIEIDRDLAARLSGTSGERQAGTAIAKAALRGQRRRYKTSAQHVS